MVVDRPSKKNCPHCGMDIPIDATKCYRCQSDLEPKGTVRRLIDLRELVTLPTAVIALVVALYNPIADSVRKLLHWDGANLSGYILNPDTINVGLDDRPAGQRVTKVTQYENLLRVGLSNGGYSLATLSSNFACTGDQEGDKRYVFSFDFYDPKDQKKVFPQIDGQSATALIGKLNDAELYTEAELGLAGPRKCSFGYFDKYGHDHPPLVVDLSDEDLKTLKSLIGQ